MFSFDLFGPKNMTRDWPRDPNLQIEVDLDRHALCGVPLGAPIERLKPLGPSDRSASPDFRYSRRGLWVAHDEGIFTAFTLFYGERNPFAGTIRYKNRSISLDADVSASTIRAGLGEPYFIQKDGPDETWFYEFGSVEWQLEWFKGRFQDFLAQTEPELADEAARREYGVDKPWPF